LLSGASLSCVNTSACLAASFSIAVWFAGSTGLMAMSSTPLASRSSRIRFCAAAVPSPSRNSTVTPGNSASAFSVPFRAMVQKSAALFVMKASLFADDCWRPQPPASNNPRHNRTAVLLNGIRFSLSLGAWPGESA